MHQRPSLEIFGLYVLKPRLFDKIIQLLFVSVITPVVVVVRDHLGDRLPDKSDNIHRIVQWSIFANRKMAGEKRVPLSRYLFEQSIGVICFIDSS